jgi:eukaryotic-like serine/threonine-protein kinase
MKIPALFCALFLCFVAPTVTSAKDPSVAMFRGNPSHTGVYDAVGVPKLTGVKWKLHTNGFVISSPAVANGMAYVGSTDGHLYAIDLAAGTQKWKFKTDARVVSSPAVENGVVYFGSYDGKFYAVDAASGQLKWKFATAGERRFAAKHIHGGLPEAETMPDPFDCYLSSPAVSGASVYFGSGDGNVYALDAATGKLNWKFQTGDVVHASPAIADGTLFVGSWDSYFYALDAATGKEKWKFKTGEDHEIYNQVGIQSSAAVADGIVYFGCRDSNLYALDARTGEKKWAYNNKGSWVIVSPAVKDGRVYFATSDSALFHAVDAKSGAEIFSLKLTWPMFASPAIAGDLLYQGSEDGKLRAIDLKTQKPAWEFQTEASQKDLGALSKPDGTPNYSVVFAENFYDSMVIAVNKLYSVGMILSSPVIVDDVIYFGSMDGNLYAIH